MMLNAYFNYPNSRVETHSNSARVEIQKMGKVGQRIVAINPTSITLEIQRFGSKHYRFASDATFNDMWVQVNFADAVFEMAVVNFLHRLISRNYSRFKASHLKTHC